MSVHGHVLRTHTANRGYLLCTLRSHTAALHSCCRASDLPHAYNPDNANTQMQKHAGTRTHAYITSLFFHLYWISVKEIDQNYFFQFYLIWAPSGYSLSFPLHSLAIFTLAIYHLQTSLYCLPSILAYLGLRFSRSLSLFICAQGRSSGGGSGSPETSLPPQKKRKKNQLFSIQCLLFCFCT